MKNYTITVNGNVYDVVVEEGVSTGRQPIAPRPAVAAPVAAITAPTPVPVPVQPVPAQPVPAQPVPVTTASNAGSIRIEAGAAGKICKIESKIGQVVKRGDAVVILEAMKMEIPVVAPSDGTVTSINVAVGDSVDAGVLLATLS